jgi:hypothetical protein
MRSEAVEMEKKTKTKQRVLLGISLVLVVAALAVGLWVSSAIKPVIETKIAFDLDAAITTLKGFDQGQLEAYRLFQERDFVFMIAYAIALLVANYTALTWESENAQGEKTTPDRRWRLLLAVPVIAALFDLAEDLTILSWLNGAEPLESALTEARLWGIGKFTFFAIALLIPVLLTAHRFLKKRAVDVEKYENAQSIDRTYKSLRAGLAALVFLLLGAVVLRVIWIGCVRGSISAYYYTALQPVFVGTLIAVGVCLIVYQGTTYIENILLDVAGFLAFVVAFVPTAPGDDRCEESIIQSGIIDSRDIRLDVVQHNVFPLLAVTLGATLWALVACHRRAAGRHELIRLRTGLCAQVAALVWLSFFHESFRDMAHGVAAFGLFACIIGVVWSNHLGRKTDPTYRKWRGKGSYWVVAVFMGLTLLGVAVLHFIYKSPVAIFVVEFALILEFASFWVLQSRDLQGYTDRVAKEAATAGPK